MINQHYKDMLSAKSVIRELSEVGTARAAEIGTENVFDYSLGNPSVPAPEEFKDAVINVYEELDPMAIHGYSPTAGHPFVKEKIAEYLKETYGINYGPNHIFPTAGCAAAIAHAVRAVTCPGDTVLCFAPYFPEYNHYVGATGANLKLVPPDEETFMPDMEKFEAMIDKKVTAVLINTPNNPSGAVYDEDTLKKMAEILTKKSEELGRVIFMISDEPYREICYLEGGCPYPSKYYKHSISCYSYSKSLSLPGERIGYLAVHPEAEGADTLVAMCGQISRGIGHNCPTNTVQLAVARVLGKTSDLSVYEKNKDILYECLKSLGMKVVNPGGTFYIFAKALEEDATAFCKKALKYDLVLVPSESFGIPGYFRVAYCVPTEKVERSVEAFKKFVEAEYGNN